MISIRQNILTSVVKLRPKHDLNQIPSGTEGSPSLLSNVAWHYHGHRDKITLHHMPMQPDVWVAPQSQHLNKENKKLRKLPEIAGRGIFRHDSKIMSQSLRFILYMKRTHLQQQEPPHVREPQKTGRFFLCWSSINLCLFLSRHSSWQPVIDRLTKLGAKYRSFELYLASVSTLRAVYEEHQQTPNSSPCCILWSWGGCLDVCKVCRK